MGTLVIALPSVHEGGELIVRHRTREQVFDWSLTALPHEPRVQWAAFYSDCEHEVLKVESGVCITVVYDLRRVRRQRHLYGEKADPEDIAPKLYDPGIYTG